LGLFSLIFSPLEGVVYSLNGVSVKSGLDQTQSLEQIKEKIRTLVSQMDFSSTENDADGNHANDLLKETKNLLLRLDEQYDLGLTQLLTEKLNNFDETFSQQWTKDETVNPPEWHLEVSEFDESEMTPLKAAMVSEFIKNKIPPNAKIQISYQNKPISAAAFDFILRISTARPLDKLVIKNADLGPVLDQFDLEQRWGNGLQQTSIHTSLFDISDNTLDAGQANSVTRHLLLNSRHIQNTCKIITNEVNLSGNALPNASATGPWVLAHLQENQLAQIRIQSGYREFVFSEGMGELQAESQYSALLDLADALHETRLLPLKIQERSFYITHDAEALVTLVEYAKDNPSDPIPKKPPFDDIEFTIDFINNMSALSDALFQNNMASFSPDYSTEFLHTVSSYLSANMLSTQITGEKPKAIEKKSTDGISKTGSPQSTTIMDAQTIKEKQASLNKVIEEHTKEFEDDFEQAAKAFEFCITSQIEPFAAHAVEGLSLMLAGLTDAPRKKIEATLSKETLQKIESSTVRTIATAYNSGALLTYYMEKQRESSQKQSIPTGDNPPSAGATPSHLKPGGKGP
jgi:hypothetical protein